ncbi:MAG: enoyl-CoA hydratase-related protein [Acidimicrobiia bacterium]
MADRIPKTIMGSTTAGPSRRYPGGAGDLLIVDEPLEHVRRLTLNRPEKRNALSNALRAQLIDALVEADEDDDIRVTIIRGAGSCFSAGYDLGGANVGVELPHHTAAGLGHWQRHVTETWMGIWDLAKPVIAQVHGYCLAGGSELATGCDLVYVADDAKIGYPAVRFGAPDMQFHAWTVGMRTAMEMMLTGDPLTGAQAAELGWANRAFPIDRLEEEVLLMAERVARIDPVLAQINKRTVHRQMEVMGIRTGIRIGTELSALSVFTPAMDEFMDNVKDKGLTSALQERDEKFSDYRASHDRNNG